MKFLRLFGSLKFTALLILMLGVLFLAGLWIPQKRLLKRDLYEQWRQGAPAVVAVLETLKLTEVYSAPLTLTVWGLFFINLTTVMVKRVGIIGKRIALPARAASLPDFSAFPYRRRMWLASETPDQFFRVLEQQGFTVVTGDAGFLAVKNRYAPVATILFHLSFYLILAGALLSTYTKFVGMVNLSEGESFSGELKDYALPPQLPKIGSPTPIRFTVLKVVPVIQGSTSTDLRVSIGDEEGKLREIGINRPYRKGAVSCVVKNLGVCPLMVLSDGTGELDGIFVKLDLLKGKEDRFEIGPYRVLARLFPDYEVAGGVESSKSEEFRNPALHLKASRGERVVAEGTLKRGEALSLGSERLEFREMPFWVGIAVVEEHGLVILYGGFLLGVVALAWRFGAYRRELCGRFTATDAGFTLDLAGRSEFYRALTEEEFDAMLRNMKGEVSVV